MNVGGVYHIPQTDCRSEALLSTPVSTRCRSDENNSPQTVIVKFVVRGESDETAPARRETKENLHGSVAPDLLAKKKRNALISGCTYVIFYKAVTSCNASHTHTAYSVLINISNIHVNVHL